MPTLAWGQISRISDVADQEVFDVKQFCPILKKNNWFLFARRNVRWKYCLLFQVVYFSINSGIVGNSPAHY